MNIELDNVSSNRVENSHTNRKRTFSSEYSQSDIKPVKQCKLHGVGSTSDKKRFPPKSTSTRKWDVKNTFCSNIAKLEKEFRPRNKAEQQKDPLYDKLKEYHDVLL